MVFLNYIKAKLIRISEEYIIVEIGNIGFKIYCAKEGIKKLEDSVGKEVLLYISEVLERDKIKIYGFLTEEERDLFEALKDITGVGVKIASRIVANLSPREFRDVIESEDLNTLLKIPGVGKKIAQKIFLEIKGIVPKLKDEEKLIKDTLLNLGYNKEEVEKVIKEIRKEYKEWDNLEEIVKYALKKLAKEI